VSHDELIKQLDHNGTMSGENNNHGGARKYSSPTPNWMKGQPKLFGGGMASVVDQRNNSKPCCDTVEEKRKQDEEAEERKYIEDQRIAKEVERNAQIKAAKEAKKLSDSKERLRRLELLRDQAMAYVGVGLTMTNMKMNLEKKKMPRIMTMIQKTTLLMIPTMK
jgi:hypothetical protein